MTEAKPTSPSPAPASAAGSKTVLELITVTTQLFAKHNVDSPRLEAELLLAHVLGVERIQLYVRFDQPLAEAEVARFRELVKRRGRHEPVHYILGHREFWSLDLQVERGVLIPRPDTECLVEEAVAWLRAHPTATLVADVGTGSGAIAIALAKELPTLTVYAGDVAEVPLRVAADNAKKNEVGERVTVVRADLLAPLAEAAGRRFDVLVSNPPYIALHELATLEPHVRDWEPREALLGGADGLDVVRALVAQLATGLALGGAAFIEVGSGQGEAAKALFAPSFDEVRIRKDYAGLDRVIVATGFRDRPL